MTKKILSLCAFTLLSTCTTSPIIEETNEIEENTEPATLEEGIYTIFSLNVHDFVFPEKSIEAVTKVIAIHEEYSVPVDIYLDDHVLQIYIQEAPELIEQLKNSPMVTVGYHIRPPYPYYTDFDFLGLSEMSDEELMETLMDYETHALDLETGLPTEAPGGYAYLKEVMGYAPPIVAIPTGDRRIKEMLAEIYEEMGATFTLAHNKESSLGDESFGLQIRPEHIDYKLYEKVKTFSNGEEAFADAISQLPLEPDQRFIGMKYHEDNFYCIGTPFWPIYWTDSKKGTILDTPYDLEAPYSIIEFRPESQEAAHWALYESTVKYASEHAMEVNPLSVSDLEEL